MNYSTTNSQGASLVAQRVGHFLLFPNPNGGAFVAFLHAIKTNPHLFPGVGKGGSGFTLTGALSLLYRNKVARKVPKKSLGSTCVPSFYFTRENKFPQKCSTY